MATAAVAISKEAAALQVAVAAWKSASFTDVVAQMEQTVTLNKQQKEQSLTARKTLADTTKQFKRSVKIAETAAISLQQMNSTDPVITTTCTAMDALSKECRITVKSYQEEIDNLTRRCKAAEQGYAAVFLAVQELPDPAVVLHMCQQQLEAQALQIAQVLQTVESVNQELIQSEKTNQAYKQQIDSLKAGGGGGGGGDLSRMEREELVSLRKEVAEYEVEFRSLKNQDITIRKLEDKIYELQTVGAESIRNSIEQARQELALTEGRRATEALEREAAMEAKMQTLELQLRSERAGREATQNDMLVADDMVSSKEAAWEAQRQILVDDNERVREALQTVKRERDELSHKLAAARDAKAATSAPSSGNTGAASVQDLLLERNAYEAEVSELSETNALLRDEIRMKEDHFVEEKREYQAKIDALEREKSSMNTTLASLESQLSAAPNQSLVDNMKRELRILKRLEYNADDVDTDRDPEIVGGGTEDEKDLEAVLVAKLRRSEKELISERNGKTELMKTTESLKQALAESEKAKQESDKLVASLEQDLERAIATPAATELIRRESKGQMLAQESSESLQHILDPNAPPPPKGTPSKSSTATEKAEDDHSVATIVMAQRDRLRARCEALEAERDSFKRELQGQVQASESLKADNTKLYEKVRYLQNYNTNNKGTTNMAYRRSASTGDRDLDLEALEQRYEASVDPFKQFSKSERQRKLGEMSPMERTVFMVAKAVLSTKEMRTGLFFYVVALHLLVFVTTYHWSHAGGCDYYNDHENLSHLPPALPPHIQQQIIAKDAAAQVASKG